jgi:DNA modification methylase
VIPTHQILIGDAAEKLLELPDRSVQMVVTSPPYYGLRDYGDPRQLGSENTPQEYIHRLVGISRELRRVLRDDGTYWLNLGDSYYNYRPGQSLNGFKEKDRMMIPAMVALALRADGWYLRDEIVWHKPNPMPESTTDRTTKAHEFIYLLTKQEQYFYDGVAIKEPYTAPMNRWGGQKLKADGESMWDAGTGQETYRQRDMRPDPAGRNKRSVWTVNTSPYPDAHFATYPPELITPCILAGTSQKGCCSQCGAPWERVVEKGEPDLEHQLACGSDMTGEYSGRATKSYTEGGAQDPSAVKARILAGMTVNRTIAWKPTCECSEGTAIAPCTVLDPFGGRGTTAEVAIGLGRSCILIELNPKYAELCRNSANTTPGLPLL